MGFNSGFKVLITSRNYITDKPQIPYRRLELCKHLLTGYIASETSVCQEIMRGCPKGYLPVLKIFMFYVFMLLQWAAIAQSV